MCLTSDIGGYYTGAIQENRDQFGLKGDFVTSPEISQVFGELVGVWFVTEWMAQGRPNRGVELIEMGPGRGTLMDDMLRTLRLFKGMASSLDAIYMVEASPELRMAQKNLLCGEDAPITESKSGYHSMCKYMDVPIVWTETIRSIPQEPNKMPLIVAHEFFDALPIHSFQNVLVPATRGAPRDPSLPQDLAAEASKTSRPTLEWREFLVSPSPPGSTHDSLNTPLSERNGPPPDFQLHLARTPTRHSLYLPGTSSRYQSLNRIEGATIEISPDTSLFASNIASLIGGSAAFSKPNPSGAALIIDYGPGDGTVPVSSLRGIRKHKRVSPFSEPGLVDLSADVDFGAIVESSLRTSEGIEIYGPAKQADFLEAMGGEERAQALASSTETESSKAEHIMSAWRRLTSRAPGGMGNIYKVMAILPENDGRRTPVGFGGGVVE